MNLCSHTCQTALHIIAHCAVRGKHIVMMHACTASLVFIHLHQVLLQAFDFISTNLLLQNQLTPGLLLLATQSQDLFSTFMVAVNISSSQLLCFEINVKYGSGFALNEQNLAFINAHGQQ